MLTGLPLKWRWRVHQSGGGAGHPVGAWPLAPGQEALEGSPPPTPPTASLLGAHKIGHITQDMRTTWCGLGLATHDQNGAPQQGCSEARQDRAHKV